MKTSQTHGRTGRAPNLQNLALLMGTPKDPAHVKKIGLEYSMGFNPIIQAIIVILILMAAVTAIFGPRSWLWISAGFGLLAGMVVGLVQSRSLQGVWQGLIYGVVLDIMFVPAGFLTRYLRDKESQFRKLYKRNKKDDNT